MKINLATKITILRICLIPLLLVVLLINPELSSNHYKVGSVTLYMPFTIAFVIFVVAALSDAVDGHIARKTKTITNLGKFLDPIADKLLVNTILIYLASIQLVPVILVILMVARDVFVDALRLICIENGFVVAASKYGKLKTVFQMVSISLVLLLALPDKPLDNILLILFYITTFVSVFSGIDYFNKNKQSLLK